MLGLLTANNLLQFCALTSGLSVSAEWIALAVESTSPVQVSEGRDIGNSQGLTMSEPARLCEALMGQSRQVKKDLPSKLGQNHRAILLSLRRDVLIRHTIVSGGSVKVTHRFIPSRVEVTKHASARAYMAVNSSKGTDRCMKTIGVQVGVPNCPLMRPTSSLTQERRFMYSSTSCLDGIASWMRMTLWR